MNELAKLLVDTASKVMDLAVKMKDKIGNNSVSLAHQQSIRKGLAATEAMCVDAQTKLGTNTLPMLTEPRLNWTDFVNQSSVQNTPAK